MIDLDTPLVMLSEDDPWTIRDSFEGLQMLGGTGAGKTSSAKIFAMAFLNAGFGGLVGSVAKTYLLIIYYINSFLFSKNISRIVD